MKKILVAPLDWGLGHATRCIPIIRELIKRKCTVIIAGNGDSLVLLKAEFPQVMFYTLPGYEPTYPSDGNMVLKIMLQIPKFIRAIKNEHSRIESIVQSNHIDLIISDNRYGCWSRRAPSIFLSHQLNILMPKGLYWMSMPVNFFHRRLVKKFTHCWIPDYPDKNRRLSGRLCDHPENFFKDVAYIGPLSRFASMPVSSNNYDVVCIFSGPEPQRSIFERKVMHQLGKTSLRYFVARGKQSAEHSTRANDYSLVNTEELQRAMSQSPLVIARSGYSTIMDLAALGKKGIVVPTPGQTEQEYLARRWSEKGVLYSMPQKSFNLKLALQESNRYTGFTNDCSHSRELLERQLDRVLSQLN
jgi:uncharacterized protein (TIGR00661 family)